MKRHAVVFAVLLVPVFILLCPPKAFSEESSNTLTEQGIKFYRAEEYEEAITVLTRARSMNANNTVAAFYLGLAYKQSIELDKAAESFKDAFYSTPRINDAGLELVEVYYLQGKWQECVDAATDAEKINFKPGHVAMYKGLALSKLGRHDEAVTSFELARNLDPTLGQTALFHIASVTAAKGDLKTARSRFEDLLLQNPGASLAEAARKHVEMIEDRIDTLRPIHLTLDVNYEYDDNVVLKPNDNIASAGVADDNDDRLTTSLSVDYAAKTSGAFGFRANYFFFFSDHEELDTYDILSHSIVLMPSYATNKTITTFTLGYNHTDVDFYNYMDMYFAAPSIMYVKSASFLLNFGLRYQHKEIRAPLIVWEDRDAENYAASISLSGYLSVPGRYYNVKYEYEREDTQGKHWPFEANRLSLVFTTPLFWKLGVSLSGDAYYQNFLNKNTFASKTREDFTVTGTGVLSLKLTKRFELSTRYTQIRADSNLAQYDYNKYIFGAGFEFKY
ncbi:MAG: hypothetical protein OEV59_08865 [Deltaproteobacteria bacterium]|nr:hypothetical protein [Deltaproteobacteria bacterium]